MSKRPKASTDGLTYESIKRQFKERRIDPLYLFIGEEQYLQERALRLLYDSLDEAGRAFNLAVLSLGGDAASKSTPAQVLDYANQLPMMSNRRILVVRDFEKLKEEDCESLLKYLKQPCPTSTLVFQTASLDKRRKISQGLLNSATVVTFDLLNEGDARRWAENHLKKQGANIGPDALGHLLELVGTRLTRLSSELDKLAIYADDGIIDDTAIEQLVPRAREHTNWELKDAVLARDRKRAMRLAQRLMDDGAAPLMLVGMLASLYRQMLTAREMASRGASNEEMAKATGQKFISQAFGKRLRSSSREDFIQGLRRLAEVDDSIKNSMGTPRLQIEYLVAELTLPAGAALRYKT